MTDIGYCNTCKNAQCTVPREKVIPQRDCPKGLAWESGSEDELIDDLWCCPGCERMVYLEDMGGYRTYCQDCVDAMPELPGKGAYVLDGKYPDFEWVPAADFQFATRAVKTKKNKRAKK